MSDIFKDRGRSGDKRTAVALAELQVNFQEMDELMQSILDYLKKDKKESEIEKKELEARITKMQIDIGVLQQSATKTTINNNMSNDIQSQGDIEIKEQNNSVNK